jgi:hypothetical protein
MTDSAHRGKEKAMELEFFTVLGFLYKGLALIALLCVGVSAVIGPLFVSAATKNLLWFLLYIISPLVLAICYKILWLF